MANNAQEQDREGPGRPMRRDVLQTALELLREGPQALTVRAIAAALGTSTQAVYTSHGGKHGLLNEIYVEGYRRLRRRLQQARDAETGAEGRLRAIGRAYREFAVDNPELFQMMFCNVIPGFRPAPATLEDTWQTFLVLADAVRETVEAGVWQGEPDQIARLLWQVVHGQSQLEVAGYLGRGPEGTQQQDFAFEALARALRVPRG